MEKGKTRKEKERTLFHVVHPLSQTVEAGPVSRGGFLTVPRVVAVAVGADAVEEPFGLAVGRRNIVRSACSSFPSSASPTLELNPTAEL